MPKLHQILAIETTARAQSQKDLTKIYHGLEKPDMLTGQFNEYQPLKEDGMKLPSERKALQVRVKDVIKQAVDTMSKAFDIVAVRDFANTSAKSDVVMPDGSVLLKDAPAPYLLWLEKQITDLHTVICKLPTLPADTEWEWDTNQNCFKNKYEVKTAKTEKVQEPLVLHPPTPEHPAQTQMITRDVIAGYWTKTTYHGAIPISEVRAMKERAETLLAAVKMAREKANQVEAPDQKVGSQLLNYVFGGKA
jgi:hypothetical protein